MFDRFFGLGHDRVIRGNYKDGNISSMATTTTHSRKGSMTWSVDKGNLLTIVLNLVGSNSFGNTSNFTCGNSRVSDPVQERCFTMIYMSKDSNHRRPGGSCCFGHKFS